MALNTTQGVIGDLRQSDSVKLTAVSTKNDQFFENQVFFGQFFSTLAHFAAFRLEEHQIPKGALIQSATITVQAVRNDSNSSITTINAPGIGSSNRWKPAFSRGSVINESAEFKFTVRDTDAAVRDTDNVGAQNSEWGLRVGPNPASGLPQRETLSNQFEWTNGGFNLGEIELSGRANGSPVGNVWVEVYAEASGLPTGSILATSDLLDVSTVAGSAAPVVFEFSGADQINPATGTYMWTLRGDYPASFPDIFVIQQRAQFNITGKSVHFGAGSSLGDGNYPSQFGIILDFNVDRVSSDIEWTFPAFVNGQSYTSPDLSPIVQAYVNQPSYVTNDPIPLLLEPKASPDHGARRWAAVGHPSLSPLVLDITWLDPTPQVYLPMALNADPNSTLTLTADPGCALSLTADPGCAQTLGADGSVTSTLKAL